MQSRKAIIVRHRDANMVGHSEARAVAHDDTARRQSLS